MKHIRKRDGSVVHFKVEKIEEAIWKAAKAVGGQNRDKAKELAEEVISILNERHQEGYISDVEEVQDLVEKTLIENGHAKTAKAYILYRKSHEELRNVKGLFDTIEAVEDYIGLNDWMIKENSNMGYSLQGLNNYISTKIVSNYWLRRIYPEEIRKAHENADLHIHDLGTLGSYCFDNKTKILTENGWKFFKDVIEGEKVATKNLKNGRLEFQEPYDKQVYSYNKEMYSFEGRGVSLLVTPEHRLLVRRKHKKSWEFVNPTEFKYGMEFDKKLSWKGKDVKQFNIPFIKGGNRKKNIGSINIENYLEFMGWYLSEGSVYEPSKGDYRISIAQSEKKYRNEILNLLKKMNLKFNNSSKFNIHLHSKELFNYLKKFGTSKFKYVPNNIKELNSKLIKKFLTTLFKGDGSFSKTRKFYKYFTTSKKLAEDVVECLLKINLCGTISKRKGKNGYMVSVENNHLTPIYRKKVIKKKYNGKVYDFSVKNGTLVVMREGKVVISGNCVGWDLKDLLMQGFRGVPGKLEANAPKHFKTALGQIVNFFYTLQGECYSEDTEVLTENGWKLFKNLDKNKVFTLNQKTKKIELQKPIKYFEFKNQSMNHFCNNKIDLLVTPNHNMLVAKYRPDKKRDNYELCWVTADKYNPNIHLIPKGGTWIGQKIMKFKLPQAIIKKYPNYGEKWVKEKIPTISIPMKDWLAFFGLWIAEGSCSKILKKPKTRKAYYEYYTRISQNNKKNHKKIEEMLNKLPFNWNKKINKNNTDFVIYSKQLYNYLSQFGKSKDKFIPNDIKALSKNLLQILFSWMMLGDGHINNGNYEYYTNSKILADDVQEIILKLNHNANIRKKNNKLGSWYVIAISRTKYFKINKNSIKKIKYNKKVYCVEVPNHTLYVRRNGKACWCGNSAGAQAFSNFDTLLAPFIRYDNLSYKEVKQAMQEFIFNMAVPTRVGFQSPFTNITLDLQVPEFMKSEHIIIGGEMKEATYGDFQEEMNIFNKAFVEVMIEGDATGRVFTFPIPTYNISKKFDWDNPAYEPIWEMTAKYGIPYFSNFVNSDMNPEDARSMCCRLRLDQKMLRKRGGGLFGSNPLTGSIGVVTINMPRIGFLANNEKEFFVRLDQLMYISKESLEIKRKVIEKFTDMDLYPYSKFYLKSIKERFGRYWENHFGTIGLLGMNEAIINLMPEENISSEKGRAFAIKVLDFMRERLEQYQEKTGNIYNLEATPGEGTTYRFARADKKRYNNIIVANEITYKERAVPYYTNSTHLPVNYTTDIFEALELQDELQSKYTGGTVFHGFVGEKMSKEGIKLLVKKISENFKLPYFTITPTFSICPKHGYIAGDHEYCPKCDQEIGYVKKEVKNGTNKMREVLKDSRLSEAIKPME